MGRKRGFNDFEVVGDIAFISIYTNNNITEYATVDAEDVERIIKQGKWREENGYATNHRITKMRMHRFIMNVIDEGIYIDHINMIGTDNRKSNLRLCTHNENLWNQKVHKNNKLGIKGLSTKLNKSGDLRYFAQITKNKISKSKTFLVTKEGKEQAIKWLKETRKYLHGEFHRN